MFGVTGGVMIAADDTDLLLLMTSVGDADESHTDTSGLGSVFSGVGYCGDNDTNLLVLDIVDIEDWYGSHIGASTLNENFGEPLFESSELASTASYTDTEVVDIVLLCLLREK